MQKKPSDRQRLEVMLFAGMAEMAGRRCIELDWQGGSPGDLRSRLAAACPAIGPLVRRSGIASGDRYLGEAEQIPPGGQVAVIPPVSGG